MTATYIIFHINKTFVDISQSHVHLPAMILKISDVVKAILNIQIFDR